VPMQIFTLNALAVCPPRSSKPDSGQTCKLQLETFGAAWIPCTALARTPGVGYFLIQLLPFTWTVDWVPGAVRSETATLTRARPVAAEQVLR